MSTDLRQSPSTSRQLRGWKEIAALLGKDESTVKRWAASRGLPIHRIPGSKRASVFAWSDEIASWLTSENQAPAELANPSSADTSPNKINVGDVRNWRLAAGSVTATLLVALAAIPFIWQLSPQQMVAAYHSTDKARTLYLDGVYLYQKRTPESLRQAAAKLEQAVMLDTEFARAETGLAVTYDLMVEYAQLTPEKGYQLAEAAAQRALRIDGSQAEAHAVLGDVTFFWRKDYAAGLAHLRQSIKIDPENALSRHWYGSALMCAGRYQEALAEINEAQRLDPASRSSLVSKAMILLAVNDIAGAEDILKRLIANEPGYRSPYRFLAFAALAREDYPGYLRALRTRFDLTHDDAGQRVVAAGTRAEQKGGVVAMRKAMVGTAAHDPALKSMDPYFLAQILSLSGDFQRAARQLGTIKTRHAFYYGFDPAFTAARLEPSFLQQVKALGLPVIQ